MAAALEIVQARGLSHCFENGATARQDKQKTAGFYSHSVFCFNISYSGELGMCNALVLHEYW